MGEGDHDRGRQSGVDVLLPETGFEGVHSCAALKPPVNAIGWRWIFRKLRDAAALRRNRRLEVEGRAARNSL